MGYKNKEEILNYLFENQDEKYKKSHAALCPGVGEDFIIGVRVPVLRALAKQLKKDEITETGTEYYEQIVLNGMLIGLTKFPEFTEMRKAVEAYLPFISNWAVCDIFCGGLKQTKKFKVDMLSFLTKLITSPKEYNVRFAAVMLLSYYLEADDIDGTLVLLKKAEHEGYYAKMAVAWALSAALVKHYNKTLAFMKENNFDKFTQNKAVQKARESYRITVEQKEELKELKR